MFPSHDHGGAWGFYGYYGSPTLQGANQLYPLVVTGSGYTADGPIDWDAVNNESRSPDTFNYIKWVDFQKDMVTGGNGGDAVLLGDCKFAAFTITSGDSLDLNGQRAEFSGAFDLNGSLDLDGSMAIFKHTLDLGGKYPSGGLESDADTVIIHDPPSASEKAITSLYAQGTFFARGAESEVTGYPWRS